MGNYLKLSNNEVYDELVVTALENEYEYTVIVNTYGVIVFMSKAYREFCNAPDPIGKHVTEVIENTRMHIVLKTGIAEIGRIQSINNQKMLASRIPITKDGKIIGAFGRVMFKDINELFDMFEKVNNYEEHLRYYKDQLEQQSAAKYSFDDIVGVSENITTLKNMLEKVAQTDSTVLITGESGTGKELFAHSIHRASKRSMKPFVKINCAAIPPGLLEEELFGYSSVISGDKRFGKFELADEGTLFFDEIAELPLEIQSRLLRVIQDKEIDVVGFGRKKPINVRIIASTYRNIEEEVKRGTFRNTLFYRLNVIRADIDPLRERKEDVETLANHLLEKISGEMGIYCKGFSEKAMRSLVDYDWPGNTRELRSVVEGALNFLDKSQIIGERQISFFVRSPTPLERRNHGNLDKTIRLVEKRIIADTYAKCNRNKKRTAEILGISRTTLYQKLEEMKIK